MNEIKIALCGKARSGKDTVRDYLVQKYSMYPFAFADELRKDFHKEYPHVPKNPKPVKGYQLFGQLKRYIYGENYWINKCQDRVSLVKEVAKGYSPNTPFVDFRPVISDVRQPNEIEWCKQERYTVIRINSDRSTRVSRMEELGDVFDSEVLDFETETHVDKFKADYDINNDGTLEDLYKSIDEVMKDLKDSV